MQPDNGRYCNLFRRSSWYEPRLICFYKKLNLFNDCPPRRRVRKGQGFVMIIVLKPGVTQKQVEDFSARLAKQNQVKVNAWYGEHSTVLGLLGDTAAVDIESIAAQDIVQSVKRVQEPFKKANRKFHPDDTVIDLGGNAVIGGGRLGVIAGPCSVESEEQIEAVAARVKASGAAFLRGGAFKPRTSLLRFPGPAGGRTGAAAPRPKENRPAHCHRNHVARPFGSIRGCGHHPGWSPEYAEL